MADFLVAADLSARSGMALRRAVLMAKAGQAGLILAYAVNGTGRSGLEGAFLGGAAEQVPRRAAIDALVAPPPAD